MVSNFPDAFDSNDNLYLVHDALRLRLAEDYNPGDTTITVEPDDLMARFPLVGIITLTEQCNDIDKRALSFFYSSRTETTFTGLELFPCFVDVAKGKRVTNVTQNVMAEHHNTLKDALIAIETFIGVKGDISLVPLQGTMEARINFLRNLVLKPKAWFVSTKQVGVVPLCIEFKDFSTRQPSLWIWNFGDGSMSTISRTQPLMTGTVSKCYYTPGIYNVSLTVENDFGENSVTINEYVTARVQSPDAAEITFIPDSSQISDGTSIRSRTNTLISMLVSDSGQQPTDPVVSYTWSLGDDLNHDASDQAVASYSIGGTYDVRLRAETELGSYRQTVFTDAIDIVESVNLWHFIFDSSSTATTKDLVAYEFGLIDETYKTAPTSTLSVTRNAGFLSGVDEETRQVREFRRNNGFSPTTLVGSGDHGHSLIYWAEGAATPSDPQVIRFREYDAFAQLWITPVLGNGTDSITRRWNWLSFNSAASLYFLLGNTTTVGLTNQNLGTVALNNYAVDSTPFSNYQNGADELITNVGGGADGDFSVYRGTWRDSAGYFVRNDGTGNFFRLKSFYATEGTLATPLQLIRKLTDMPGSTKFEGQMVPLTNGVYFFNNTGEVLVYNPVTNVWASGGPGVNSPVFSRLQDTAVAGYDSPANTLVASGDQDHRAYLSFDYSTRAMLKFNEIDLTFTTLPVRPSGEQFLMGVY